MFLGTNQTWKNKFISVYGHKILEDSKDNQSDEQTTLWNIFVLNYIKN